MRRLRYELDNRVGYGGSLSVTGARSTLRCRCRFRCVSAAASAVDVHLLYVCYHFVEML